LPGPSNATAPSSRHLHAGPTQKSCADTALAPKIAAAFAWPFEIPDRMQPA